MKTLLIKQQQGAVLIVALVMLLILTIIGVAGLQDTQLQEKMAGGYQDRDLAFQAAETALRGAEEALRGPGAVEGICTTACASEGYVAYDSMTTVTAGQNRTGINDADWSLAREDTSGNAVTEAEFWQAYDWTGANNSTVYNGAGLVGVSSNPRYVIERLPESMSAISGTSNATGVVAADVQQVRDYLITARGTGATDDAVVILQSRYRNVYVYTIP